jgi:hypothetical protein
MSKSLQNTRMIDVRLLRMFFGAVALIALMSAAPPASAQVPADMLRLDPPRPANDDARLATDQRTKVRSAYARSRKIHAHEQ